MPRADSTLTARLRGFWALDDDWERPRPPIGRSDVITFALMEGLGLLLLELMRSMGAFDKTTTPVWLQWFAVSTGALLLLFRRRFPLTIGLLGAVHMFVTGVTMPMVMSQMALQIVYFVAFYSAVAWGRQRRDVLLVASAIVVAMFVWIAWDLALGSGIQQFAQGEKPQGLFSLPVAATLFTLAVNVLYFGGAAVAGQVAWRTARQRARLEEQAATIAAQTDELKDRAVLDERLRIARELHDVVGHHVSVIGVQAGAARRTLTARPELAAEALTNVEQSARDAVTQMRALLGTLREHRSDPNQPDERAPEPGLHDLPGVLASQQRPGFRAELSIVENAPGAAERLSGPVALTLHRVAQEALANVTRHSTASEASVTVRIDESGAQPFAEVEVVDNGRPRPGSSGSGLGHLGIRERVASHHGLVEIGPRALGGYRVRVRLPLGAGS